MRTAWQKQLNHISKCFHVALHLRASICEQRLRMKHQSAIISILNLQWSHIWQSYCYLHLHKWAHLFTVSVTRKCLTTFVLVQCFYSLPIYNEVDRLVGNRVECNGCTWFKACNSLTWCPSDQWWAGCRKKDEKQVWTGLLLASVKFLQAFASQKMWSTQVTLVSSVGLHLTVCLSTLPITVLDLLWTAGNGTLKDLKQIVLCVCVCMYVCIHTHTHTHTHIY